MNGSARFVRIACKGRRSKQNFIGRPSLFHLYHTIGKQLPLSVGETGAATRTAAGKNLAAVGSGHSLAEAVLLGALELLGLVGARSSHFVLPPEKILPAAPLLEVLHLLDGGRRKLPADRS